MPKPTRSTPVQSVRPTRPAASAARPAAGPAQAVGQLVAEGRAAKAQLARRAEELLASIASRKDPAVSQAHKLARSLTQQLRACGATGAVVTARYSRSWRLRIDLGLDAARALGKALG
jgi:hypothetical protein